MDLAAIKARADAATPGPWKLWAMSVLADPVGDSNLDSAIPVADTFFRNDQGKPRTFDATFIAHAREDVPAMVAAIERAIFELDRIPEYAYTGHTPTCQGEPGCPLCRALAILRGYPKDDGEVLDDDLPGMWEKADFLGGAPDVVRGPDYTPPTD